MRWRIVAALWLLTMIAIVVFAFSGCSSSPPKPVPATYPVTLRWTIEAGESPSDYRLVYGLQGKPKSSTVFLLGTSRAATVRVNPGIYSFQIYARVGAAESDPSNQVEKTVP